MPTQQEGAISGIGKDSSRTDLKGGTPGRKGGLPQGETGEFEQGQKSVSNTQGSQPSGGQAPPTGQAPRQGGSMEVPDAIDFAKKKLGGSLEGAAQGTIEKRDFDRWLPFLRRMAVSPTASGIMQRAYVERLSKEMNRPMGGSAAIIRQRDFDQRLEDFNAS